MSSTYLNTKGQAVNRVEISRIKLSPFTDIVGDGAVHDIDVFQDITVKVPVSKDTTISGTSVNNNYGTTTFINVSGGRRGLIYPDFEAHSIDSSSNIKSATVNLYDMNVASVTRTENGSFGLYAIKPANGGWIEGTKNGATATSGEPTWNHKFFSTVGWTGGGGLGTPGNGYDASPMATIPSTVGYTGPVTGDFDIDMLKGYLTHNSGMLLRVTDETKTTTGTQFASREAATVNQRGYFEIVMALPGNPEVVVFTASGSGAKVVDGFESTSPGTPIPTNGLLMPAKTVGMYRVYVPAGVTVTWWVEGYE